MESSSHVGPAPEMPEEHDPPADHPNEDTSIDLDAEREKRIQAINKMKALMRSMSLWSFLDPSQPWLLLRNNGSFMGFFDFVPEPLRMGPWSGVAIFYLTVVCYLVVLGGTFLVQPKDPNTGGTWQIAPTSWQDLSYPAVGTTQWYYHAFGCIWMLYIISLILRGPISIMAWSTYTVQSWTLLCLRHGLCAFVPLYPQTLIPLVELMRFPVACSATVTFLIWNVVLMPFLYFVALKKPFQKRNFLRFCFEFRLVNIHFLNLPMCFLNCGTWGSPARYLTVRTDFYLAVVSMVLYMLWYFVILDRVGVHLYPVFSPRIGWLVALSWTAALALYIGIYYQWKGWIEPQ